MNPPKPSVCTGEHLSVCLWLNAMATGIASRFRIMTLRLGVSSVSKFKRTCSEGSKWLFKVTRLIAGELELLTCHFAYKKKALLTFIHSVSRQEPSKITSNCIAHNVF